MAGIGREESVKPHLALRHAPRVVLMNDVVAALLTPSQFLQVLPHLPAYTDPIITERTFRVSGLRVLHIPTYTPAAFAARLHGMLLISGSHTTLEIAQEEDVPTGLAAEMIEEAEIQGVICRDETERGEVRWWLNVFQGYVWDGQDT